MALLAQSTKTFKSVMQALKNLGSTSNVVVYIEHHGVTISSLSPFKYETVLDAGFPSLEEERRRIQVVSLAKTNEIPALEKLKELVQLNNDTPVKVYQRPPFQIQNQLTGINWDICEQESVPAFPLKGCSYLFKNVRDEAYTLKMDPNERLVFINNIDSLYPHILVEIGEEVVFTKVISSKNFELLGTSNFNFETLFNLYKPLIDPCDLLQAVGLAKLFSAITNGIANETNINLPAEADVVKDPSIAHGLIKMFYDNIAQMSSLYAKLNGVAKIIFRDNMIHDNLTKKILVKVVRKFSGESIEAIFLRHERFVSGLGSLLAATQLDCKTSWFENYCESTGLAHQFCFFEKIEAKQLTLDSLADAQVVCPLLLNPAAYVPDLQNLVRDDEAREYWIKIMKNGIRLGIENAVTESKDKNAAESLSKYKENILDRLDYLNNHPQSYGELCMRILQDTLEHMKRENGLITFYEKKKELENKAAIEELEERLNYLDSLDHKERQEELIISMLAGNMFDWGAKKIIKLIREGNFGFMQAMEKLPVRPWTIDNLDQWVERTRKYHHKLAMVFCDNCGYDLILGVIPFVRDLLQRGTKVIICANKDPVLNDVTFSDLKNVLDIISNICPIIGESYVDGSLSTLEISKSTCCIDLRSIDVSVAEKMTGVDLLVIIGMGRTIHVNLDAEFNCEALRVAVVKDTWLSNRFGSNSFACICKHTL